MTEIKTLEEAMDYYQYLCDEIASLKSKIDEFDQNLAVSTWEDIIFKFEVLQQGKRWCDTRVLSDQEVFETRMSERAVFNVLRSYCDYLTFHVLQQFLKDNEGLRERVRMGDIIVPPVVTD